MTQVQGNLISALKSRQHFHYREIPTEFVHAMKQTHEFRDLSQIAIGNVFKECQLIELDVRDEKNDQYHLKDPTKVDFFYLIKGKCSLNFQVTKIFSGETIDPPAHQYTQKAQEYLNEEAKVKRLSKRLQKLLVQPYFNTELSLEQNIDQEVPEITKLANEFMRDPKNERDKFPANAPLLTGQSFSSSTLMHLSPNYEEYFAKVHDIITREISFYPSYRLPRKVIRYQDNLLSIQTVSHKSYLIRLPYEALNRIVDSHNGDYKRYASLIYTHVPFLTTYSLKQREKIISLFKEEEFFANQVVFKEGQALEHIYLIAEGDVKLTSCKNPYTQKYYKNKKIASNSNRTLQSNIAGTGNLSKTIIDNNLGYVTKGQWLGEEYYLLQVPLLYSAVAISKVKVLKISISDFQTKIPKEIQTVMERKMMEKMDWIRQRLETLHNVRREIAKIDPATAKYEKTVNHIKNNYPMSNTQLQQSIRKSVLEQSGNNPYLLLLSNNQRLENKRLFEEKISGVKSLKTVLFEQERMRKQASQSISPERPQATELNLTSTISNKQNIKRKALSRTRNYQEQPSSLNHTQSPSLRCNGQLSLNKETQDMKIDNSQRNKIKYKNLRDQIKTLNMKQESLSIIQQQSELANSQIISPSSLENSLRGKPPLNKLNDLKLKNLSIQNPKKKQTGMHLNSFASSQVIDRNQFAIPQQLYSLPQIFQCRSSSVINQRSANQEELPYQNSGRSKIQRLPSNTLKAYESIKQKLEKSKHLQNACSLVNQKSNQHNNSGKRLAVIYNQRTLRKEGSTELC